ncbi:MAG TPA: DUF998 domain-containing protein [Mycobacterium sp.]|nr:DUF998 domain-containing protein [Mycobacterium sp.]
MTAASTAPSVRLAQPQSANTAARRARTLLRQAARSVPSHQPVPIWAIVSAGLSPILLAGAWLLADTLQPADYSPLQQTMSVLAGHAATDRWIMTGAIFAAGICQFITAAGLTAVRASARILLTVAGATAIGIAASPEPAHGTTTQHLAWTVVGAVTIAIWPAFVARRAPTRPLILSVNVACTATAISLALLGWVFIETQSGNALGLAERLTTTAQTSWPLVVSVTARRATTSTATESAAAVIDAQRVSTPITAPPAAAARPRATA